MPELAAAAGHCPGCGSTTCPGCQRALDPPRFCPDCGRRLTVAVHPGGYRATCRTHGERPAAEAGPARR